MKNLSVVEAAIHETCTKTLRKIMENNPWFVFKNASYGDLYKALEFAKEIPGSINCLDHAVTYNNPFYKHLKHLVFSRLLPIYVADMTERLILTYSFKSPKDYS